MVHFKSEVSLESSGCHSPLRDTYPTLNYLGQTTRKAPPWNGQVTKADVSSEVQWHGQGDQTTQLNRGVSGRGLLPAQLYPQLSSCYLVGSTKLYVGSLDIPWISSMLSSQQSNSNSMLSWMVTACLSVVRIFRQYQYLVQCLVWNYAQKWCNWRCNYLGINRVNI